MNVTPFALERYFARYEFTAPHILCASDCETFAIRDLLALEPDGPATAEAFAALPLGYIDSRGTPALRQAVAGLYEAMTEDSILVHTGAEEAVFTFMHAVLSRGDHIVVHSPCYQSLASIARDLGCRVTPWIARPEHGWLPDPDELRRAIGPATRAVVVNTPHNPTGCLFGRDLLLEIVDTVEQHGLRLFADEVYRGLELDPSDRLPAACDLSPRAVSLGVLSKTYGLPGLRVGWAASRDQDLLERMARVKDYTTICGAGPSEFLGALALRHADVLAGRNLEIIRRNLALLHSFFDRHAGLFQWVPPKASSIAFPSLTRDTPWADADDFCARLVENKGVLLLPGSVYGFGNEHFRLGFGRRNMPEALALLDEFVGSLA